MVFFMFMVAVGIAFLVLFLIVAGKRAETELARKEAEVVRKADEEQARIVAEQARIVAEHARIAEEGARRVAEERRRMYSKQQEAFRTRLAVLDRHAVASLERIPSLLETAEGHLDEAERDFGERAFSPFWTSLERAIRALGEFDEGLGMIADDSEQFGLLVAQIDGGEPTFSIDLNAVRALAIASSTSDRIAAIVRKAQRDIDFAKIYEMRRTNQILTAGFQNLGAALDGIGGRIEASIERLGNKVTEVSSRISEMSDKLDVHFERSLEASEALRDGIGAGIAELHESVERDSAERRERTERALEMLDNIQHRRRPEP